MFEQPEAKRIRRNELHSPASSPRSSLDPELDDIFLKRTAPQFIWTTATEIDKSIANEVSSDGENDAELRLFATPSTRAQQTHKIRVKSPEPGSTEPGFVVKERDKSYYFADEINSKKENELSSVALDGEAVVLQSRQRNHGLEMMWKVTEISRKGIKKCVHISYSEQGANVADKATKRRRKGKKSRIALRKKARKAKAKLEETERAAKEKDEADREKRTRKNREKKAKKRLRDKAKKLGVENGNLKADELQEDNEE